MSINLGSVFGKIRLDTSNLKEAEKTSKRVFGEIDKGFARLGASIGKNRLGGAAAQIEQLNRQIRLLEQGRDSGGRFVRLTGDVKAAVVRMKELRDALKRGDVSINDVEEELAQLSARVRETTDKMGGLKNKTGATIPVLRRISDVAQRAGADIQTIGRGATRVGAALSAGLTAPLALLARRAVQTQTRIDQLHLAMVDATGSTEEANRQIARLEKLAKKPGLQFEQALWGSVNLQAVNLSAELAERSLSAFGNALALAGRSSSDLDGVNLALTQIVSKGKVSAEEINQIAERVPQIRTAMIDAFGTADTEIIQKLGLGAEEFIERVVTSLEGLPQAATSSAVGLENAGVALNRLIGSLFTIADNVFGIGSRFNSVGEMIDAFRVRPIRAVLCIVSTCLRPFRGIRA